jgi:hypothetical protein
LPRVRPLTTIACLAAALALLAGCGGDDETTSSTTSTTEPTTTPATGPTGPTGEDGGGGGGSEGESRGEGGKPAANAGSDPESALEEFFTSGDPDLVCGELATEALIADAYGDEQGCRQAQVPDAVPESIEVKELDESGDAAEALVVPKGGPNDGFDHEVLLVREGDVWVVDSLEVDIPAGP